MRVSLGIGIFVSDWTYNLIMRVSLGIGIYEINDIPFNHFNIRTQYSGQWYRHVKTLKKSERCNSLRHNVSSEITPSGCRTGNSRIVSLAVPISGRRLTAKDGQQLSGVKMASGWCSSQVLTSMSYSGQRLLNPLEMSLTS